MRNVMTPAEVLRKAADVIRERGWCQGSYTDDSGACCAYGAIDMVANGRCLEADRALMRVVPRGAVASWNDDPRRTKEEVIAALEKAAELAEGNNGV